MVKIMMGAAWIQASGVLLAQDAGPGDGGGGGSGLTGMLPLMVILFALFYFMIIRPQKNREKEFRSLVDKLKKNDRVITIGGIHGVVTNVQKELERVTLRIDEATGTTIRVRTSAISEVVNDDKKTESDRVESKSAKARS